MVHDSLKPCVWLIFNHRECLQEKAGTVTAINRRGVVAEVDFDDGVRSYAPFPSPSLPLHRTPLSSATQALNHLRCCACAVDRAPERRRDAAQTTR